MALALLSQARELQALALSVATQWLQDTCGTRVLPLSRIPSSSQPPWSNVRRPWQECTGPVQRLPAMEWAQKSLGIEWAQKSLEIELAHMLAQL